MTQTLTTLPDDLPRPIDDGAANHLTGLRLPPLSLTASDGAQLDLSTLSGRTVIYIYPMTGRPGEALPEGWDAIPGARGCTPQSCSFRDHFEELRALDTAVFGFSAQSTEDQQEARERLHLPFPLLSDEALDFKAALGMPTFEIDGASFTSE